jgi:type IV secretion system protein VirB5
MRRILLATTIAAPLFLAGTAKADLPVIDFASLTQLLNEVRTAAQQLAVLQQQLQQIMGIYQMLSHITNINGIVAALGMLGIQNPLPVDIYAVQSLLAGRGGASGMLGSIGSLFNTNVGNSSIYSPTGNSFEALMLQRNGASIGGIQALAGQVYQSMSDRLPLLAQLQARIGQGDQKESVDLNARIAVEQAYIQAQQTQAAALAMMGPASARMMDVERAQQRQRDIDQTISANPWGGF